MKIQSVSNQSAAYQVGSVQSASRTENKGTEAVTAVIQEAQHPVEKKQQESENKADNKSENSHIISEQTGMNATQGTNEEIKKAVAQLNKKMMNSEAIFGIHEGTNRVTIKIIDKTTKETIKELPPEKTLDMIAKAWELAGLLVDEKR